MKWSLLLSTVFMSFFGKIITILGLSFVTYKGLDLILGKFRTYIFDAISGIPLDTLNLMYIAGFGIFLNYFLAALSFIASMKLYNGLTSIANKG